MVIETDPIANDTVGVLQALEPMTVYTLVFEGADDPLDHAILLRAVRRDELLLQPIALDQARVTAAGEDQAIVGPQQERPSYLAQMPVAADQGLLQSRFSRFGAATAAQVPTKQFAGMAVDHQRQAGPAVPASPYPVQVSRPALIWRGAHRGQGLDAGSKAQRALEHLSAHQLEHTLHCVLVEVQRMRHRAVAKRGVLLDHGLDRLDQISCQAHRPCGHAVKNAAESIRCFHVLRPSTPATRIG